MDFREDEKRRRENRRGNIFGGCLVERMGGKKTGGAWPLECFLPKKIVDKTGENKSGLKHPYFVALTLPRFSVLLFFFFFFLL